MRAHGPSGPVACPLPPLISSPVSLTRGLGSAFTSAEHSQGPKEDGGVGRGDIPVGASGSGMARMCPWRRA